MSFGFVFMAVFEYVLTCCSLGLCNSTVIAVFSIVLQHYMNIKWNLKNCNVRLKQLWRVLFCSVSFWSIFFNLRSLILFQVLWSLLTTDSYSLLHYKTSFIRVLIMAVVLLSSWLCWQSCHVNVPTKTFFILPAGVYMRLSCKSGNKIIASSLRIKIVRIFYFLLNETYDSSLWFFYALSDPMYFYSTAKYYCFLYHVIMNFHSK